MKAYLITNGIVYLLVVLAHILRVSAEGAHLVRDPAYVALTLFAAALSLWSFLLLRSGKT